MKEKEELRIEAACNALRLHKARLQLIHELNSDARGDQFERMALENITLEALEQGVSELNDILADLTE